MDSKRRPSAATVIAVIALIVALGGTAIAAGLTHKEKRQVKSIARSQVNKKVKKVFKRIPVGDFNVRIATISGFRLEADCTQNGDAVFLQSPSGVRVDGYSHNASGADGTAFGTNQTMNVGSDEGSSSFSITTRQGTVLSGELATDFPGASGVFGNDTTHCVVHGHILVN